MADTEYLTSGDVAKLLKVSVVTVIRWSNDGTLPCGRLPDGRLDRRYKREDIEQLLASKD